MRAICVRRHPDRARRDFGPLRVEKRLRKVGFSLSGIWIRILGVLILPALSTFAPAQDVGRTLVAVGDSAYIRKQSRVALKFKDRVRLYDYLSTRNPARLLVLLVDGQEVAMSDDAEVQLSPGAGYLRRGTIRVVCDPNDSGDPRKPSPCPRFEVTTAVAKVTPKGTGFIVSCGAPMTAPDACLMVGVYGLTEVESLAAPARPVQLPPRYFTQVRPGEPPDPPRRMEESRYFAILDSTTIVGSGSDRDRLEIAMDPDVDSFLEDWNPEPRIDYGRPITDIPVDPAPRRVDRVCVVGPAGLMCFNSLIEEEE